MEVKISLSKSQTKKFVNSNSNIKDFKDYELSGDLSKQKSFISSKVRIKNNSNISNLFFTNIVQNKQNSNLNLILNQKENIEEIPEILDKLINMGFAVEGISLAYNRYKFRSLDHALNIMGRDLETGFYRHQFYLKKFDEDEDIHNTIENFNNRNSNICVICNDVKEKHFDPNVSEFHPNIKINHSIIGESNHSLINKDDDNTSDLIKNKLNKRPLLSSAYIEELEKEFKDKELCIICYANELKLNSFKLSCGHTFCKPCIQTYLENQINESRVENIKCLQAGCKTAITASIIKDNVSPAFKEKFIRFKNRRVYLENLQRGFIPCTAPDCEQWVDYQNGMNPCVQCQLGHKFCAICKDGWHKKGNCITRHINKIMLKNNKIRTCPNCGNFIEKEDGCNHMTCSICNFEFCWICMRKYEYYHYYVFNVKGCPGMRFANPTKKNSLWKNPFIKCLWFFCTLILGIMAFILICALWFVFGASYEFIKCYEGDYDQINDEENWYSSNYLDGTPNNSELEQKVKPPKTKSQICLIYTGLIILGLFVQPFYLMFKLIQMLLECYRKLGCWFYYMGSQ